MTRTVYSALKIRATSLADRQGTFNTVNLSGGSVTIQTAWLNGAVSDGVVLIGIRSNSGNLGFVGGKNTIGPPPNDFNFTFTSTNGADSSALNYIILPLRNQDRNITLNELVSMIFLRGNGNGDGNFGTAQLSGGSVTINTTQSNTNSFIFCCNTTTPLIGPNTPDPVGNVWISSVINVNSFTIQSTEPSASNGVAWFIINLPSLTGNTLDNANVILDHDTKFLANYGKAQLTGGTTFIPITSLTPQSVVYCNTAVADPNANNRGYIMSAPDFRNNKIDFWSSNNNDGQIFYWWLMETAGGVS